MSLLSLPLVLCSSAVKLQAPSPPLYAVLLLVGGREHRVLLQGQTSVLPGCATGAELNQWKAEAVRVCFFASPLSQ